MGDRNDEHSGARAHFVKRVRQRLGDHIDASKLFDEIATALRGGRDDFVRFKARSYDGRAIYRCSVHDEIIYIIACKETGTPITILPREHPIYRGGFDRRTRSGRKLRRNAFRRRFRK